MYAELVIGGGRTIWRSRGSVGAVIPADGCVDLILRNEDVFVAGPSTRWIGTRADSDDGALGLRLLPGAARSVLALDLSEISDQVVLMTDLLGHKSTMQARTLLQGVRAIWPDAPELVAAFSTQSSQIRPWVAFIHGHARRGTPPWRVAELLDWSPRTFRRRMLQDFGYPYLTLTRIDRAKRTRALLKEGSSLVDAAAIAGYADQSHLSREFRRLVGVSPGQFLSSSA